MAIVVIFAKPFIAIGSDTSANILMAVHLSPKLLVHYTAKPISNSTLAVADQFGALGILALGASMAAQTSRHSAILRKTMGDFGDRSDLLLTDMQRRLAASDLNGRVDVTADTVVLKSYFKSNGIPRRPSSKASTRYDYLIFVEETAGMRTGATMGTLSASSWVEYNIFDADSLKSISKGNVAALADTTYPYDSGVMNPNPLKMDYSYVSDHVSQSLIDAIVASDVFARGVKKFKGGLE